MVYIFNDFYENEVKFSFEKEPFSSSPKHVFAICLYNGKWLLTHHRSRGLEFPGGKVEAEETVVQAAHREVMEETGATIKHLHYVGQYYVNGKGGTIIKNVYFAQIDKLLSKNHYFETKGPVLLKELPKNIKQNKQFSFMMKDDVLTYSMDYIARHFLKKFK